MTTSQTIVLAGGCFWGVERYFQTVDGVTDTTVGYANSRVQDPGYKRVCTGLTGAAEAVKIVYDPQVCPLERLLTEFFTIIDPYSINRQGNDCGTQYRTGIYWTDPAQEKAVRAFVAAREQAAGRRFAVECGPLENFYPAEDYHQDYLLKNPGGYCHIKIPKDRH